MPRSTTIGLISDTHGLMRPEALVALRGVSHIIHAGDIGSPDVLAALREIAEVTAVRGNNDVEPWARDIPETAMVAVGGHKLYVLHDIAELAIDPREAGLAAVIAGHSHKPRADEQEGVLYVNPGSAGPRRFSLPIAVARLTFDRGRASATIVELNVSAPPKAAAKPRRP